MDEIWTIPALKHHMDTRFEALEKAMRKSEAMAEKAVLKAEHTATDQINGIKEQIDRMEKIQSTGAGKTEGAGLVGTITVTAIVAASAGGVLVATIIG